MSSMAHPPLHSALLKMLGATLLCGLGAIAPTSAWGASGNPSIGPAIEPPPALPTPWYSHWFRDQNNNRIDDWLEGFAASGSLDPDFWITFKQMPDALQLASLDSLITAHGGTLTEAFGLIPTVLVDGQPLDYPLWTAGGGGTYNDPFMQALLEDWEYSDDLAMVEAMQEFDPPTRPPGAAVTPRIGIGDRGLNLPEGPSLPDQCAPSGDCWIPQDTSSFELQADRVVPDLWQADGSGGVSGLATGRGTLIAFLDSGISACGDDENRFVGGYDATAANEPGDSTNFDPPDTTCDWLCHGSRVFYSACGAARGADGVFGAAPEAGFIDVNLALDSSGYTTSVEILRALNWIYQHSNDTWQMRGEPYDSFDGIDVVNISYADQGPMVHRFLPGGGPGCENFQPSDGTDLLSRAINILVEFSGIPVVVAGGNCGADEGLAEDLPDPGPGIGFGAMAAAKRAITVAAYDAGDDPLDYGDDATLPWSNHGRWRRKVDKPDVAAPGLEVFDVCGTGTSFSAPQVAGIVALLREVDPTLRPGAVQSLLRSTGVLLEGEGDADGYNDALGRGRVDAAAAYTALQTGGAPTRGGARREWVRP